MENNKNLPVKSLSLALIVLILIVVGLTASSPSISKPELQVARVLQQGGIIGPSDQSCGFNFNVVNLSYAGSTPLYIYNFTLADSVTYTYKVDLKNLKVLSSPLNAPKLNISVFKGGGKDKKDQYSLSIETGLPCRETFKASMTPYDLKGNLVGQAGARIDVTSSGGSSLQALQPFGVFNSLPDNTGPAQAPPSGGPKGSEN